MSRHASNGTTFVEERTCGSRRRSRARRGIPLPFCFDEITGAEAPRTPTGIAEFDRVLGGGVVPGALMLLGGDPGVGKSTLMLDVCCAACGERARFSMRPAKSPRNRSRMRGERMQLRPSQLHIYAEMSIEKILAAAEQFAARAVVIDSVQTTFSEKLEMAPGSIGQVREVASQLLFWAKKHHIPVFLIGHITKDGALAGPKALEHIVDTVLYFEGPRQHPHRIVRTIKNRFGPANELGIFEMASAGLIAVEKPSALFLSHDGDGRTGIGRAVLRGGFTAAAC